MICRPDVTSGPYGQFVVSRSSKGAGDGSAEASANSEVAMMESRPNILRDIDLCWTVWCQGWVLIALIYTVEFCYKAVQQPRTRLSTCQSVEVEEI